jgi:crotonobetainyl-CoA:carnitine CoA-transferase CaiB-like acyl-CoA transferase
MSDPATRRPLHGIRVLDFSMFMAGPYCTRYLADLGADVIKVEPVEGDNLRHASPQREGFSSYFGHINVGKRSVVIDLKTSAGCEQARCLAREVDVIVENGRPGTMKRFGLDHASLCASDRRLIYCSISGYGQEGPGAHRPAFAQTMHAASGLDLAFAGYQDGDRRQPPNTGIFTADILAGLHAFSGLLTALYDRERTGQGQFVDVSLLDGMLNFLPYEVQDAQFPSATRRPVYKPLRTLDGHVMLGLITQKNFEAMFDLIGHPELKADERCATPAARALHWDSLMETIQVWTAQYLSEDCVQRVSEAGIPGTTYCTVAEVMRDPQVAFRGSLSRVSDGAGEFQVANLPFTLSRAATRASGRVPSLGEHTEQVLGQGTVPVPR